MELNNDNCKRTPYKEQLQCSHDHETIMYGEDSRLRKVGSAGSMKVSNLVFLVAVAEQAGGSEAARQVDSARVKGKKLYIACSTLHESA